MSQQNTETLSFWSAFTAATDVRSQIELLVHRYGLPAVLDAAGVRQSDHFSLSQGPLFSVECTEPEQLALIQELPRISREES